MDPHGVRTVNRIILFSAVLQTLMAGFCARQLACAVHWGRIQWYPDRALTSARAAAEEANEQLECLSAFVTDGAATQEGLPDEDRVVSPNPAFADA